MGTDDPDSDVDLYEFVRSLRKESPRKRGRPRTGHEQAAKYASQVSELVLSGWRPWAAVQEVARREKKSPLHIAACKKMFKDDLKRLVEIGLGEALMRI
jgi:hypothetical protein